MKQLQLLTLALTLFSSYLTPAYSACDDLLGDTLCQSYKALCKNEEVKTNCAKTCGVCDCVDKVDFCDVYVSQGSDRCDPFVNSNYLRENCAKTCGMCPGTTAAPVTLPPATIEPGVTCGKKPAPNPSIVGGSDAQPGDWPWQVTFTYPISRLRHYCGGTLVAPRWVVTAAHCAAAGEDAVVTLGQHRLDISDGNEQEIRVSKIISHPKYSSLTYDYDVALLKLAQPAQYNARVKPACLIEEKMEIPTGTLCYISGWGTIQQGRRGDSTILQQARVALVHHSTCAHAYSAYGDVISGRMQCAGFAGGEVDTCQGDSGGPLICESAGAWYLTGITSWGIGCAWKGYYGVYADVKELRGWITSTISANTL